MIDRNEKIEHELIFYKSGGSLLATVKHLKEYMGCGLKVAKWIVDSLPDRRGNINLDEENKLFKEFGMDIELTKDSSIIKLMISLNTADVFRMHLEDCGNVFTLSGLKVLREKKLSDILD